MYLAAASGTRSFEKGSPGPRAVTCGEAVHSYITNQDGQNSSNCSIVAAGAALADFWPLPPPHTDEGGTWKTPRRQRLRSGVKIGGSDDAHAHMDAIDVAHERGYERDLVAHPDKRVAGECG